jgi:hypothetical protein
VSHDPCLFCGNFNGVHTFSCPKSVARSGDVRTFKSGATRDTDEGKLDYEGFLSPYALHRYALYMHTHRIQSDGSLRSSDNWQKGIPFDAYMKSGWRHFMDWWMLHRQDIPVFQQEELEDALCALIFNAMGYLHELLTSGKLGEGNQLKE